MNNESGFGKISDVDYYGLHSQLDKGAQAVHCSYNFNSSNIIHSPILIH